MKKTLAIFGVIILALVVLGAVCLVAVHARLDASSRAYVDMSIPRIISPWDQQQLSVRASSDYLKNVSDEQMAFDFKNFSRLGKLKNYEGSKGTSFFCSVPRQASLLLRIIQPMLHSKTVMRQLSSG